MDVEAIDEVNGTPESGVGAPEADGKRGYDRSTISFPYNDLEAAIDVARNVQKEAGYIVRLPGAMGYSGVENGAFKLKLAAARVFGLIKVQRDQATLTDLGERILDPSRASDAKIDAFLTVPLYQKVADRYNGRQLPGPTALEEDMVRFGVAAKQKDKARQVFQRAAEQAGFFQQGKDRFVTPKRGTYSDGVPNGVTPDALPPQEEPMIANLHVPEKKIPTGLPPAFEGLVQSLADQGASWSEEERKAWLQAIEAAFTFAWPRRKEANGSGAA